jgi:hypothetical protein
MEELFLVTPELHKYFDILGYKLNLGSVVSYIYVTL